MPPRIHPTALIDPSAKLAEDVVVGPFCVVGAGVQLRAGVLLHAHVVIEGQTTVGEGTRIWPFAVLGTAPQDLKYQGEPTTLVVGPRCQIREHTTVHRGTSSGGGITRLGEEVLVMAGVHVAHDCQIGARVVLSGGVALAGHVQVGEGAVIGGLAGVHQFTRVGALAMVAAGSMVSQDVPPGCLVQGDRARLVGINRVGLTRAGLDADAVRALGADLKRLFWSGLPREQALAALEQTPEHPLRAPLVEFMRASARGVCRPGRGEAP